MKFLCLGADVDVDRKNVGFTRPGTHCELGGGFKYFLFSPLLGEDSNFD